VSAPVAEDRPHVPRWGYTPETAPPRRTDLLILLALITAVILGLCIVLGTSRV
jgi:hypothetical protein